MRELRELVGRYIAGETDFAEFRRAMVVGFLSSRNEPAVESIATAIEVDCSDFSDGLIAEDQLKRNIVATLQPWQTTNFPGTVVLLANYDFPAALPSLGIPSSANGTFSGACEQSIVSAQLVDAA